MSSASAAACTESSRRGSGRCSATLARCARKGVHGRLCGFCAPLSAAIKVANPRDVPRAEWSVRALAGGRAAVQASQGVIKGDPAGGLPRGASRRALAYEERAAGGDAAHVVRKVARFPGRAWVNGSYNILANLRATWRATCSCGNT
eukprot:6316005-Prymnesium_polylepis.1